MRQTLDKVIQFFAYTILDGTKILTYFGFGRLKKIYTGGVTVAAPPQGRKGTIDSQG